MLTNAEKQARWRERHIERRRTAQRVTNLLIRQKWPDGQIEELAGLLRSFLTAVGVANLRRALKPITPKEMDAINRKREERICDWWLREHPA